MGKTGYREGESKELQENMWLMYAAFSKVRNTWIKE